MILAVKGDAFSRVRNSQPDSCIMNEHTDCSINEHHWYERTETESHLADYPDVCIDVIHVNLRPLIELLVRNDCLLPCACYWEENRATALTLIISPHQVPHKGRQCKFNRRHNYDNLVSRDDD